MFKAQKFGANFYFRTKAFFLGAQSFVLKFCPKTRFTMTSQIWDKNECTNVTVTNGFQTAVKIDKKA
jgi:hypothetical protein